MFSSRSLVLLLLLAGPPGAQATPLFTFAQASDSQPQDATHQARFEEVVATLVASGTPGALLPHRVGFVLFAGDLVDVGTTGQWQTFLATIAPLAANGIPLLAVPGNHDRTGGGISLYEQSIASADVWDVGSAIVTGHNGVTWSDGLPGLRIIGVDSSDGGEVSSGDVADVAARIVFAEANDENVLVMGHYSNEAAGNPLRSSLEQPTVVAFLHGHTGSPQVSAGLVGVANPAAWKLNSNSIKRDGALIYIEVYPTELRTYVLELVDDPSQLPPPTVLPLVHEIQAPPPPPPPPPDPDLRPGLVLASGDAKVRSNAPNDNFGSATDLRMRSGTTHWNSYVAFDVPDLAGAQVVAATLRLFCVDFSTSGGHVHRTSSDWNEATLTYGNAPAIDPLVLDEAGEVDVGEWVELDVSAAVDGAGPVAFALTSDSPNSVYYSSREGAQPPELELALSVPPLDLAGVTPTTVDLLAPGTDETVVLNGSGFTPDTTLAIDGVPVDPGAYTVVDGDTLTLDMPQVPLGPHTLTVRRGGDSVSTTIDVVLPTTPKLQTGSGDPGVVFHDGDPAPLRLAGEPGDFFVVFFSVSSAPSVNSFVSLDIGNGFAQLSGFLDGIVPPTGLSSHAVPVSIAMPLPLWLQAVSVGGADGAQVSNVQSIVLLP